MCFATRYNRGHVLSHSQLVQYAEEVEAKILQASEKAKAEKEELALEREAKRVKLMKKNKQFW